jgi:hypothetical protein
MRRQNAEQWDGAKPENSAQAYIEARREMWNLLADKVGEQWEARRTEGSYRHDEAPKSI